MAETGAAADPRPVGRPLLPHAYPFRLLDCRADGTVGVLVSGNAALLRGAAELPAFLAVEALAQAALVALAGAAAGQGSEREPGSGLGLLAGVQEVRFLAPLRPGDRLTASTTLLARLGPLVKVRAELRRDDQVVAEGELLLASAAT